MAPLIATVGRRLPAGTVKPWPHEEAVAVPSLYINALRRAGAEGAILHPVSIAAEYAADLLNRFDGLLLIGGPDIDPSLYGEEPHPATYGVDRVRDEFEFAMVRTAVDRGVPTLAICRGIQVLNVALGGTLHQHIPDREAAHPHGAPEKDEGVVHPVQLEAGSLVAKAIGADQVDAHSHHHQAIAGLGQGLRPVGWTEDGVIEAVELEDAGGWVLGVQWHPEQTAADDPHHQALFEALVERAGHPSARA